MIKSLLDTPYNSASYGNDPLESRITNIYDAESVTEAFRENPGLRALAEGMDPKEIADIANKVNQAAIDGVVTKEEIDAIAGTNPKLQELVLAIAKVEVPQDGMTREECIKRKKERENNEKQESTIIVDKANKGELNSTMDLAVLSPATLLDANAVSRGDAINVPSDIRNEMRGLKGLDDVLAIRHKLHDDMHVSAGVSASDSRPDLTAQPKTFNKIAPVNHSGEIPNLPPRPKKPD